MVFWKTLVDDRLGTDGVFGENHWKVRRFHSLQKGYFRFRGYPTVSGTEEELRKSGHTDRHSCDAIGLSQTFSPFLRILRAMEDLVNSHQAIFTPVKERVWELPRQTLPIALTTGKISGCR
jgi:hypothetical protein